MVRQGGSLVYSGATVKKVAADLAHLVDFQEEAMPTDKLEALLAERLAPHLMRYDLPQFQSMFNAFPPAEALMGAQMALEYNQGVTNWQVSPGGVVLEVLCCRALCQLFGLGPESAATFMLSGTYGNQQALYLALHHHAEHQGFDLAQKGLMGFDNPEKLALLVSESAHFSIRHAVRVLGLGEDSLVRLPVDGNYRLDVDKMKEIAHDLGKERDIFCLVATAGTTTTGSVDPIAPLATWCAERGIWLHVDGAYGYAYKLVPRWSALYAGDHRADSITWDPHKQLGAPIPNSILFLRNGENFGRMALHSHYFNRPEDSRPNPGLKSPPSTRPMSVLPLVTLLRGQGLNRVIEGLSAPLVAISELADGLRPHPEVKLFHEPDTGILCFQIAPTGLSEATLNTLQRDLYERTLDKGERSISIARLNNRNVLRLVAVKPNISFADLLETVQELQNLASELTGH